MDPNTQGSNKRIAKNTLILYFRMFLMMAISLYTSRIILKVLGVEDYGINNVVGGLVALFSMITGALSVTVGRYITFELGRGDLHRLRTVFSTSVVIQCAMALFICFVAEVVGVWFLETKINIPIERLSAAHWVLQCSIISFMFNLVSVPYNAAIVAHEKMSAFAYISLIDVALRLLIVFMLNIIPFDKLIVYAILQLCVSMTLRLIYGIYCSRHFWETHFKFVFDKQLIKEMFSLVGWAFWGNGAIVMRDQGSNMMLNVFCGPAVNAARGVAVQVNTAVYNFTTNFLTAIRPQITKSYSSGNLTNMHNLLMRGTKYGFFILLILLMPLCANVNYVLSIWLVEVPAHTASFIVLTLIYSMFDCFGNPLVTGVLAQGDIRNYEIALLLLCIFNCVASYLFLRMGYAPEWVFVMNVVFKVFIVVALVWHSHVKYAFPVRVFLRQTVSRCVAVFAISYAFVLLFKVNVGSDFANFVISCLSIALFTALVICAVGLTRKENKYFASLALSRIKKGIRR
ncbi:MAG: oligosaccharide flippase family protein [Prevotellaceae bacterium]|nr:oligosaccharide flippase family protein [Prevotellaceae bacterium]